MSDHPVSPTLSAAQLATAGLQALKDLLLCFRSKRDELQ